MITTRKPTSRKHTIRQHAITLAAAVLSLTALSACDEAPDHDGSTTGTSSNSPTSPTSPTSSGTPTSEYAPASTGVTIEELADDMRTAEEVVDAFWATHWPEYFTGDYSPPAVVGLYDGNDTSTAPSCGDELLGPGNAFYCSAEDFVAWDAELMLRGAELGDAWVYLVIAHEWGHAIQARLSPELQAAASEPQADCLAGAALYGAEADGRLTIEEGDEKEIVESLSALADELAWTSTADHGDAFERVGSFDAGRLGGVEACLPE